MARTGSIAGPMSRFVPDPARTRVLAERWGRWILPHWLERQADPTSPSFVPAPPTGGVVNSTCLDRVPVGVLDGVGVGSVDPRGLVTGPDGGWSLDWWVGADDRWHVPSREVAVRQSLLEDVPVAVTAMRVPGGDVVQRVWGFRDASGGDLLAVEFENASRLPLALALAVRPYGPDGAGRVGRIEIGDDRVLVDGTVGLWLDREPARRAASTLALGDVATTVLAGGAGTEMAPPEECRAGFATASIVVPVPHTAVIRVFIPLDDVARQNAPSTVPPADAVARGWASHLDRHLRVEIPDPELAAALRGASAQLLLAAAGRRLTGEDPTTDTAALVGSLDRLGLHDEARLIVASLPAGQGTGGRLGGVDTSSDATSAALVAAARHWRATRDAELAAELAGPLAAGAHHHTRGRSLLRRGPDVPDGPGELAWRLRAMLDVSDALGGGGQPDAADAVADLATEVRRSLDSSLADAVASAAPLDVGTLVAGAFDLVDPSHPAIGAVLDGLSATGLDDGSVAQLTGPTGLSPHLTSLVARVEMRRGDATALDRLGWLVRSGGDSRSWSDLIHPRLGMGCGGDGASVASAGAVVDAILDLLVQEGDQALVLCPVWPRDWLGAGIEVHGITTTVGRLSFAIRWHGARPALLWELDVHPGVGPVTLTIPGLDPSWSSTEARGDALLAAPDHLDESRASDDSEPSETVPPDTTAPSETEVSLRSDPEPSEPAPGEGDSFA